MDGKQAKQQLDEAYDQVQAAERQIRNIGRRRAKITETYHDRISKLDDEAQVAIVDADKARDALRDRQRSAGWVVDGVVAPAES